MPGWSGMVKSWLLFAPVNVMDGFRPKSSQGIVSSSAVAGSALSGSALAVSGEVSVPVSRTANSSLRAGPTFRRNDLRPACVLAGLPVPWVCREDTVAPASNECPLNHVCRRTVLGNGAPRRTTRRWASCRGGRGRVRPTEGLGPATILFARATGRSVAVGCQRVESPCDRDRADFVARKTTTAEQAGRGRPRRALHRSGRGWTGVRRHGPKRHGDSLSATAKSRRPDCRCGRGGEPNHPPDNQDGTTQFVAGEVAYLSGDGFALAVARKMAKNEPVELKVIQANESTVVTVSCTSVSGDEARRTVQTAIDLYGQQLQQRVDRQVRTILPRLSVWLAQSESDPARAQSIRRLRDSVQLQADMARNLLVMQAPTLTDPAVDAWS